MAGEIATWRRKERWLAYVGAAGFAVLLLLAGLLWLREGSLVYLARIISELPNCL